ncbi:MAG: transposase [Thermodesulfovibrionales bacterium]
MDLTHARTRVYKIGYRLVFCAKYRAEVLSGAPWSSLQEIVLSTTEENGFRIQQMEANENLCPSFVLLPPHVVLSVLVKWIKGFQRAGCSSSRDGDRE